MSSRFVSFLITLFQCVSAVTTAQNLVPDPSFEDIIKEYPQCTSSVSLPDNIKNYLRHWCAPTPGTADIFLTTPSKQCPNVIQFWPRTGSHVLALITYVQNKTSPTTNPNEYREYAQTKLTQALVTGKKYYAEMYVSVQWYEKQLIPSAIGNSNNMGFLFTTDSVYITGNSI